MTEVHREGDVSLHVLKGADIVKLRDPTLHGGVLRHTTAHDLTLVSAHKRSEGGLSINEVCRRYADRADVDFEVAAAAVLDALEAPRETAPDADGGGL